MNKAEKYFKEDIINILANGYKDKNPRPKYKDGTPAHTISVNQNIRKYNLGQGEFPIITLRPIAWKTGIKEILAIYQKQTNSLKDFHDLGIMYWDDWDIGDGTIGQRYGHTVKRYDLINKLIEGLKNDPYGRRHIMSLWQEEEFIEDNKGLNPCAFLTMWNVRKGTGGQEYLDMSLIQRSGDMICASGAGNINEVQYAALLMMIAQVCGYKAGVFVHFVQNEQIYDRHIGQAEELYYRNTCSECVKNHPCLEINPTVKDFYNFTIDDFKMKNYPLAKIKEENPQLILELGI